FKNIIFNHGLKNPVDGDFERTLITQIKQDFKLKRMTNTIIGLEMENVALIFQDRDDKKTSFVALK
ncbi:hypothetical protein MKX01_000786, partial [Papaver californicum]